MGVLHEPIQYGFSQSVIVDGGAPDSRSEPVGPPELSIGYEGAGNRCSGLRPGA